MIKPIKSKITVLWLCLAALLAGALIFPEVFWQCKCSFTSWSDYLIDFQSTFALTGFFYQGGIQLWDFFGQLPHVFFWLTQGMFIIPNILTAIVYVVFSPLAGHSAQFFNQVFALVYIGSLLCIRTIGIFLLLKRLTNDAWILRVATVIFALLFCPPAFMLGTFYQSYFPLLMYFILSFFLTWHLRYLGMALLFMLLSFSQGMIHTCYMYLGINMLIVSCCIYSFLTERLKISRCQAYVVKNARTLWMGGLGLLCLSFLILGPYIYMQMSWLKDLVFGADQSRLTGFWSASHYFHSLKLDWSPPADFFRRMLDFTNMSGRSFFLGYMMFFLSGLALTMSADRRKWIFVMAIILVWFLNFPRDTFSIGLIGHWINVLTNPLKVMVRSYQTAINSIIGYLFMPLAVLGLLVLKDLERGLVLRMKGLRWFGLFLVIFAVNGCSYQPTIVRAYFAVCMTVSLTALGLLVLAKRPGWMRLTAKILVLALILTDVSLSAWQMKQSIATNYSLRPHFLQVLPQQAGTVGLDFHNPKIFPFVGESDFYSVSDHTYMWTVRDMSLNFNSIINRQTAFVPIDNYSPRPLAFAGWKDDPFMRDYLAQNDKLFYFAKYAVQEGPGIFETIVRRHLGSDVMMVGPQAPSLKTEIPAQVNRLPPGRDEWFSVPVDINDEWPGWVYKDGLMIWDFPIQGSIPSYFATNILTHDHWVRFFIQTADQKYVELTPAQGQLIRPMTFDVQNIKEGKVYVALPANTSFAGMKGILALKSRDASGITAVWLHHSDDTGINFEAPANGWLGIQYPYDSKWRIVVDGRPIHFYRVNKSFIGFPVSAGEHKILIRYWPGSWLRWGLPLSVILTFVLFMALIIYALRDASYE